MLWKTSGQGKATDAYFEIYNAARALLPAPIALQEDQAAGLEGFDTVMHTWRTMVAADTKLERLETALSQMNNVGSELRQRVTQIAIRFRVILWRASGNCRWIKQNAIRSSVPLPDYLFNFYSDKSA